VPGPQVVGDLVHGQGGEPGEHLGLDGEEPVSAGGEAADALRLDQPVGGLVGAEREQFREGELGHRPGNVGGPWLAGHVRHRAGPESPGASPGTVASVTADPDTVDPGPEHRVERDTMGEVRVPAWALWGAQTQRAVENFPISGLRLERPLVAALARIKGAAALANVELGVLPEDVGRAIAEAAAEVAEGRHDDHFPVDVFQTGSGTSSNMNANEVIARLASQRLGRPVHPNDEVNASQSSNDVFPSAIHVAAAEQVARALLPAAEYLAASLRAKAQEFATV